MAQSARVRKAWGMAGKKSFSSLSVRCPLTKHRLNAITGDKYKLMDRPLQDIPLISIVNDIGEIPALWKTQISGEHIYQTKAASVIGPKDHHIFVVVCL